MGERPQRQRPSLVRPRVASSLGPTVCDLQFAVPTFWVPATLGDPSRRREGHREERRSGGGTACPGRPAGQTGEAGLSEREVTGTQERVQEDGSGNKEIWTAPGAAGAAGGGAAVRPERSPRL